MYYTKFETDLCPILLIGDEEGLVRLHMMIEDSPRQLILDPTWTRNDDFFATERTQLIEYARGTRTDFHIKLNPHGTDYQKKIWGALTDIPYGSCVSYKDIAIKIGNPKASRAVGMANGKNPIPIIIPCHRVIGSSGKLTGFAFGLEIKERMINLEKDTILATD